MDHRHHEGELMLELFAFAFVTGLAMGLSHIIGGLVYHLKEEHVPG